MKSCPLCHSPLEARDCTPCYDCGGHADAEKQLQAGLQEYTYYQLPNGLYIQLCNFCAVDFGSYKSEFLGLPKGKRLGFEHFNFVKTIEARIEKDLFCTECGYRLAFLKFLQVLREMNKG